MKLLDAVSKEMGAQVLPWERKSCVVPAALTPTEHLPYVCTQAYGFLLAAGRLYPSCQITISTTHHPQPKCGEEAPGLQAFSLNHDRE